MTAVAIVADLPSTGCVPGVAAYRLPVGAGSGRLDKAQFFDGVAELLQLEKTVICVYPSWQRRRARHAIRLARSLLGTERVIAVPSGLPPLALSLVVDLLAYLANHVPPGVVIAMLDRLAKQVAAGAWLGSVTKFQHAMIPFTSHLRSYLPGSAFVATIAPEQRVRRAAAPEAIPWWPTEPVQVLAITAGGAPAGWLQSQLSASMRPSTVKPLPPLPVTAEYWGSKKYIEFVAFSTHHSVLTNAVRSIRYRPCSWCAELVTSDPCPFCRMAASRASFQPSHSIPENQRLPAPGVASSDGEQQAEQQAEPYIGNGGR